MESKSAGLAGVILFAFGMALLILAIQAAILIRGFYWSPAIGGAAGFLLGGGLLLIVSTAQRKKAFS